MYSDGDTLKGWVAPFGHPGIKACSQLPQDFRSVPRPSSPLGAKASTRCPSHAHKQPGPSPKENRPHPPCTGTIHAPKSCQKTHRTQRTPNPTAGLHTHHTQHTHKTPLTAAAQPALSRSVSQRRSLGQTPMPAKPRTPPNYPRTSMRHAHADPKAIRDVLRAQKRTRT